MLKADYCLVLINFIIFKNNFYFCFLVIENQHLRQANVSDIASGFDPLLVCGFQITVTLAVGFYINAKSPPKIKF